MKDEIKEAQYEINILSNTILDGTSYKPTIERRKVLYNYITNLQKENKHLNLLLDQALKDYDEELTKRYKAIEYIKSCEWSNGIDNEIQYSLHIPTLLKILEVNENK